MLTSSHYLLGGFLAVSCAIGALLQPNSSATSNLPQSIFGEPGHETVDISYRGSGRVDDYPIPKKNSYSSFSAGKGVVAHRGSGRIRPSSI
ncbi:MAG: hypothetical protein ACFB0D_04900 [Phormidesmis sp.]